MASRGPTRRNRKTYSAADERRLTPIKRFLNYRRSSAFIGGPMYFPDNG
jgi:hypothetical protein